MFRKARDNGDTVLLLMRSQCGNIWFLLSIVNKLLNHTKNQSTDASCYKPMESPGYSLQASACPREAGHKDHDSEDRAVV